MKGLTVATFKVTDHALDVMRSAGVPDEVLLKLATIKDQRVSGKTNYVSLLQQTIGFQETTTYLPVILKSTSVRRMKHRTGLKKPSLNLYVWKVIQSTILSAVMLVAMFCLDWLAKLLFAEPNLTVEVIKLSKNWAHIGMFMVFLGVKVMHNLGIIGD